MKPECQMCQHWQGDDSAYMAQCKLLDRKTEFSFSCDKFQAIQIPIESTGRVITVIESEGNKRREHGLSWNGTSWDRVFADKNESTTEDIPFLFGDVLNHRIVEAWKPKVEHTYFPKTEFLSISEQVVQAKISRMYQEIPSFEFRHVECIHLVDMQTLWRGVICLSVRVFIDSDHWYPSFELGRYTGNDIPITLIMSSGDKIEMKGVMDFHSLTRDTEGFHLRFSLHYPVFQSSLPVEYLSPWSKDNPRTNASGTGSPSNSENT